MDDRAATILTRMREMPRNGFTLAGLKRLAGVDRGVDISDAIDELLETHELQQIVMPDFTAHFLGGRSIKRVWLEGGGLVGAEFNGEPESAVKEEEKLVSEEKPVEINAADVERLTSEGKTIDEIAAYFGLTRMAFKSYLDGKTKAVDIKEAYQRGKDARKLSRTPRSYRKRSEPTVQAKNYLAKNRAGTAVPIVVAKDEEELPQEVEREESVAQKPEPALAMNRHAVQKEFVTFSRGGQVLVAFEGNMFDLKGDEFALIEELGTCLRTFRKEAG